MNVSTFCHVAYIVNVFYWDFLLKSNTKWCIIVEWKGNDNDFQKMKSGVKSIQPPLL